LDVACAHLVNDVDVGQRHAESANASTHQPWCVRIGWAPPAKARAHRPTTGDIGQGLHASTVVCGHLENDVGQLHARSTKTSTHRQATSIVASAHRLTTGDIG